jgi:hypothetical protein
MHAPRPGGLRPAGQPEIGEHIPRHKRDGENLRPLNARHGVKVHPQLVGVVEIRREHRVRVQVDAAKVDHPREAGRVPQHDLIGGPPGRKAQLGGGDPVGPLVWGALLEERLGLRAVHEPFQRHRAPGHAAQRPVGDGQVVADEVQLGVPGPREEDLPRVGDGYLAPARLDDHLRFRHRPTIRRGLRRPRNPMTMAFMPPRRSARPRRHAYRRARW